MLPNWHLGLPTPRRERHVLEPSLLGSGLEVRRLAAPAGDEDREVLEVLNRDALAAIGRPAEGSRESAGEHVGDGERRLTAKLAPTQEDPIKVDGVDLGDVPERQHPRGQALDLRPLAR